MWIQGIGEYPAVRDVYLTHLRQVTKKLFCDLTTENRPGILYGIGVESGDPKLMTIQALETIRSCDLIVLPAVSKRNVMRIGSWSRFVRKLQICHFFACHFR